MPKANSQRLAEIMSECKLDIAAIARIAHVSPHTVKSWLRPETSKSHRTMAERHMHMIEMKLSVKKHTGTWR